MSKSHNRQEIRFLILCAVFFGVVFLFLPSADYKLTQEECDKLIKLGEDKYLNDFDFDASWSFDNPNCNSPETTILNALYFLDKTVTISPSNEPEFEFYEWAKNIKSTLHRQDILSLSGKANFEEKRISISNLELEKMNPVIISNILVHELRHLEEGFNTHVPCVKVKNTTCDVRVEENLFEGGAYNYNIAYLHQLILYSVISRSQKYSAQNLLSRTLETKFNAISIEAREKYTP